MSNEYRGHGCLDRLAGLAGLRIRQGGNAAELDQSYKQFIDYANRLVHADTSRRG